MKKLAIVGGHPKTRKKAPWNDYDWEIWTLNEAAGLSGQRSEGVFQLHTPGVYRNPSNRTDPNHWEWLKQFHGIKLWMQKKDPEVPDSIEYPLDEVVRSLLLHVRQGKKEMNPVRYFTSSFAYAIALAIYQGYQHIGIWGVELANHEEYLTQRECFTFWVGYAGGRGVMLEIHGADSIFNLPLYGYQTRLEFVKMQLNNAERVNLLSILPREGSLVTMRILRELRDKLSFSEDEIQTHKIREVMPGERDPFDLDGNPVENGFVNDTPFPRVNWASEAIKDLEISETQRKIIMDTFAKIDKEGKFSEQLLELYDKLNQ